MEKVILQNKREYATVHRHPWIFSGAVREVTGAPAPGETVEVLSAAGVRLGYGAWSPLSQIRVRMLSFGADAEAPSAAFVRARVAAAVARRAALRASGATDALRLVNAESDGLPGVTADEYAGFVVVQLASTGAERWKDDIAAALLASVPGCKGVWNRSDVDARAREGLPPATGLLAGDAPPDLIEIREGAMRFLVDVRKGHKTGFYLDQRAARAAVAVYAPGADVLNCFSYTGGFGVAAQTAGAKTVTHVDASADALALAAKNAALNGGGAAVDFTEADVFKFLRKCRDAGRTFDLIVLDPPKFADTKAGLMRALRGYKDINLLAMKMLRPGGVLATFSCSGAVTPETFDRVCAEAAFDAGRDFQILERTRQGADHPVALTFPEGLYLKGLVLRAV